MDLIRKPARWLVLLAVLGLLAVACGGGEEQGADPDATELGGEATETEGDTAQGEPVQGGSVVFGLEQEPAILNPWLTEGNLFATSKVIATILYPLWRITPEFEYEPLLLEDVPETRGGEEGDDEPFTVTYKLREEANWSDGTPISSEDLKFTWETCMNEDWDITSRAGCDEVEEVNIVDEKTADFVFKRPYAPWRELFSVHSGVVLPAHVLEGENFNRIWNDGIVDADGEPISSGPFQFESWEKGQQITVTRNEEFWGEQQAYLDEIVFRPIEDVNTLIQQFRGGEVEVIDPQPQLDLVNQIEGAEGLEYESATGPQWEHLDFNFERPPLDKAYVRRAIAMGLNREQLASELIAPIDPEVEPLNNVIWLTNQEQYQDNWGEVINYDPEGAVQLLEENGCTRGDNDIFECDGEPLEFDFVTTSGNELRELTFEVMQQQLQEIGVQITADFGEPAVALGERLPAQDYDLILFAWVGAPDPSGGDTIWQCEETTGDASLNYTGYCNPEVDELMQQQLETVDAQERADLYNEADALIAQDVPVVPLYQKPAFQAWSSDIVGVRTNSTQWGPTWNVEEWGRTE